jgi:HEAT repeat protein
MVIGDVGSSSHAPLARPFLRDRDLDVRMAAARSIGCLGFAHASAELVSATAVGLLPRFLCAEVVQALGQGAAPGISLLLADPDPSVRAVAVEMLGLVGDASFTTALGTLVSEDPSDEVRARAARSLGRIGGSDASRLLAVALDDPTGYVRVAAIGALAATGGAEWIGSIARLARSDDFDVARSAARSLALLDKRRLSVESTMWPDAIHLAEAMDRLEFR